MKHHPLMQRLAFALALSLSGASLVAFAAEPLETTEIEVVNNGKSEKLSIDDLKVGETRQLYSEAGTLVTAVRTADAIELDIAGEKTRIALIDHGHGDLGDAEITAMIEAHAGAHADGEKRIVRIEREVVDGVGDQSEPGKRKIVVIGANGETHDLHGEHPHVLIKHGDGDVDGKHVIVKRRVHKPAEGDTK